MADVSSLNFDVILNDEEFKRRVNADIKLAEDLNIKLSQALNIKGEVEKAIQSQKSLGSVIEDNASKQNKVTDATKKTTDETKKHEDAVKGANTQLGNTANVMRTISQLTGVAFGAIGIRRFVSELASATGQFEVQKMALTSMLQDAEKADEIFKTLRKNALESPYTFQDLTKFAKQLTAFNIPVDNLIETEKRLADVAAGLGVDMQRIILAYGQVKAAGVLKGTELRQFTEAGVPLLQSLAEQIKETEGHAISLSEVFARISKKQIPFEMVEEAFRRMTDEGGKFYNMQEVLVETLQGKISKLRDVWQQTLYDIGSNNDAILKGFVDAVTVLVSHLGDLGKILPDIVAAYGGFIATQAVATAGSLELAIANSKVVTALKSVAKWVAANPYALLGAAVAVAGVELYKFYKRAHEGQERLTTSMREFDTEIQNELGILDELKVKLDKTTKGTEDWADAKDEVVKKYGKYFDGLDTEIDKVGNLETAYDNLRVAVEESVRARQGADFEQKEREIWETGNKNNLDSLSEYLYNNFSRPDAYIIMNQVQRAMRQNLSWNDLRELRVGGLGQADAGFWEAMQRGSSTARAHASKEISRILEDDKKFRREYTENMRKIVKEYGLQGTAIDPDYRGPIATTNTVAPVTPKKNEPTWTPRKDDSAKEVVDDWIEINEQISAIEKENEKIIEDSLEAFIDDLDKKQEVAERIDDYIEKSSRRQHGEGSLFKLTGLVDEKNDNDRKAVKEYEENLKDLRDAYGSTSDFFKRKKRGLDDGLANVLAGNTAKFREKVRNLADDIFKEQMQGFDLTNWNDKTLSQINEIREAIEKVEIPPEVKKELEKDTEAANALMVAFNNLKQKTLENTVDREMFKKVAKEAKRLAGHIGTAASKMKEFADATGNTKLADTAEIVGALAQNIQAAADGAEAWGGWWGAIIGGVTDLIDQITTGLTDAARVAKELEKTVNEIRMDAFLLSQTSLFSNNGIFGSNDAKNIRGAVEAMQNLREHMLSIGDPEITRAGTTFWEKVSLGWRLLYNREHIAPEEYIKQGSLTDVMKRYGLNVYDQYDNLDPNSIREVIKLFGDEDGVLEKLAKDAEAYAEAMKTVDGVMSDIFGDVASSAADKIIDSWIEAGNAALDYTDILDDVARAYAKMLIQSTIMETFLDPITADLKKSFLAGDYAGAMAMISNAMDGVANSAPMFEQILTAFDPYFKRAEGSSGSSSLGSGIKSITEETASLLASYINAIRADVSYIRSMYESNTEGIASLGQSLPTLNEYMAQIAATNFDIAQSNQRILSELQSVIGAPGTSGMVVRVEYA